MFYKYSSTAQFSIYILQYTRHCPRHWCCSNKVKQRKTLRAWCFHWQEGCGEEGDRHTHINKQYKMLVVINLMRKITPCKETGLRDATLDTVFREDSSGNNSRAESYIKPRGKKRAPEIFRRGHSRPRVNTDWTELNSLFSQRSWYLLQSPTFYNFPKTIDKEKVKSNLVVWLIKPFIFLKLEWNCHRIWHMEADLGFVEPKAYTVFKDLYKKTCTNFLFL